MADVTIPIPYAQQHVVNIDSMGDTSYWFRVTLVGADTPNHHIILARSADADRNCWLRVIMREAGNTRMRVLPIGMADLIHVPDKLTPHDVENMLEFIKYYAIASGDRCAHGIPTAVRLSLLTLDRAGALSEDCRIQYQREGRADKP
jgi:hypothetical protein